MVKKEVLCFGEVLMDIFPNGEFPGGSPLNVAYHLHKLGISTQLFSSIGNDTTGDDLLDFMTQHALSTQNIQIHPSLPSGTVKVHIDKANEAQYIIDMDVAWNNIKARCSGLTKVDYLVHGSLALHQKENLDTINKIIHQYNPKVVFDVNFRSPYYTSDQIIEWVGNANILKCNMEEFHLLCQWMDIPINDASPLNLFKEITNLDILLISRGDQGAWAISDEGRVESKPYPISMADTVGCGDAFLSGFLARIIRHESIKNALDFACAVGAFIASKNGATPNYSMVDIENSMNYNQLSS